MREQGAFLDPLPLHHRRALHQHKQQQQQQQREGSTHAPGRGVPLDQVVEEEEEDKCGSIINRQADRCGYVRENCLKDGEGVVNFTYFHNCTMHGRFELSFLCLLLVVLLFFYLLGETAEEYFCPVVKRLTAVLNLAPNTAGVTFLAFGNGAPDVFSSLAAFLEGDGKIGVGAIVSGGSFVSAFVVGAVAICSGPFPVYNGYIRDIAFYFAATLLVFWVFRTGHIHLWQAALLVGYYCVFVIYVVWVDSGKPHHPSSAATATDPEAAAPPLNSNSIKGKQQQQKQQQQKQQQQKEQEKEEGLGGGASCSSSSLSVASSSSLLPFSSPSKRGVSSSIINNSGSSATPPQEAARVLFIPYGSAAREGSASKGSTEKLMSSLSVAGAVRMYAREWWGALRALPPLERAVTALMQPITLLRWATIPDANAFNRLQGAFNTLLSPLLLLMFFNDFVDFKMPVGVFGEGTVPLWSVVLLQSSLLAAAQWHITDWGPPPKWLDRASLAMAFVCSIAWISMLAQELLSCLSTLGHIMGLSPAIMGVTVLAWGNSIGDLVADVALARSGEPVVALAGCIAGPLFNMLIGLGLSLVIKTALMYPQPYALHYNPNVPVSFGFLFVSLISCVIAVPCSNYRITKPWGCCLVAIYFSAMVTSLLVESEVLEL